MCGGQFPLRCCPEGTMFTRFDANKSTKGASKLRRDLINAEIANLRELLPLPPSTRQRLSQLQLMALVCVFVRKANYFQQAFKCHDVGLHQQPTPNIGFSKALSGFLMMMTQNGKLLYISDNAAEYLGHSMEDLLIHGDSVYDIIDKQDHQAIQCELGRPINGTGCGVGVSTPLNASQEELRLFLCRMNVSRNARRQMRFGDQKVVLVQGRYLSFLPLCSRNEPVFLATCTPVAMPETRECVVQGATNVFTTIHSMDMRFMHIDNNGEHYLGFSRADLQGISWYRLLHWDSTREAQTKHRLITQSEQERSCILLAQFQRRSGDWLWLHCVLQVKESSSGAGNANTAASTAAATASSTIHSSGTTVTQQQQQQQPVIVCTNQVLSEAEAAVMRSNNWLYHYYSAQNKLQYGLAYDVGTPTSSRLVYYPEHHQSLDYPDGGQTETSTYSNLSAVASSTYQPQSHPQPHLVSHHSQSHNHHNHHHHHHSHQHNNSNHNSMTQQLHHAQHLQEQQHQQMSNSYLNHHLHHHQYEQQQQQLQQQSTIRYRQVADTAEPVDYSYSKRKAKQLRNLDLIDVEPTETDIVNCDRAGERHGGQSVGNGTIGLLVLTHNGSSDRPRMLLKVDPSDLMDQWNPSPPWSDTLQKVPDLCHQELSPYINSAPPTPTATPNIMHNSLGSSGGGGGCSSSSVSSVTASTPSAFNFDWMPEQYVPTMMSSMTGVSATSIPNAGTGTVPVSTNRGLGDGDIEMDHLHRPMTSYWSTTASSTNSMVECESQPPSQQNHYHQHHNHHLHHRLFPLQPPPAKQSRRPDTNNMERESPM